MVASSFLPLHIQIHTVNDNKLNGYRESKVCDTRSQSPAMSYSVTAPRPPWERGHPETLWWKMCLCHPGVGWGGGCVGHTLANIRKQSGTFSSFMSRHPPPPETESNSDWILNLGSSWFRRDTFQAAVLNLFFHQCCLDVNNQESMFWC